MSASAPSPIVFSDNATSKVRDLINEEGNPNLQLRVYVSGGGCSGFQYGFAFEESSASDDEDIVIENQGVRVLIDPVSLQYLHGAEVDFQDGLDGSRFIIKNPNAKSTCGCGSSFSTAENGDTNGNPANGKSCSSGPAVHQ